MITLSSLLVTALLVGQTASTAPNASTPTAPDGPTSPSTPPSPPVAAATTDDIGAVVDSSGQLVVVQTDGWDATTGRLQRYVRGEAGWVAVGPGIDVVVGGSGLAWGIGLHGGGVGVNAPRKVEGDQRAPAGAFRLTRALGKRGAPASGLPTTAIAAGDVCVDDATHPAYNHIVLAADAAAPTWKSAETLLRKDWLYDLVVVVDQNHAEGDGAIRGRGSCVFLHVWRAEKRPTAGCTAMEYAKLEDLIRWLDDDRAPLLIQLPRPIYAQVRGTWRLP